MKPLIWAFAALYVFVGTHAAAWDYSRDEDAPIGDSISSTIVVYGFIYVVFPLLILCGVIGTVLTIYYYCWRMYTYGWRGLATPLSFRCAECHKQVMEA